MNLIELDRALKQLRLGGMAAVLETRLRQASMKNRPYPRSSSLHQRLYIRNKAAG
jgi:hypothetical protein